MGIVVRLPFVPPKRRHSRLRRSGCNITAALVSTNNSLRAFGAQAAVILQQPVGVKVSQRQHAFICSPNYFLIQK